MEICLYKAVARGSFDDKKAGAEALWQETRKIEVFFRLRGKERASTARGPCRRDLSKMLQGIQVHQGEGQVEAGRNNFTGR
jgi:hypothetical protein